MDSLVSVEETVLRKKLAEEEFSHSQKEFTYEFEILLREVRSGHAEIAQLATLVSAHSRA